MTAATVAPYPPITGSEPCRQADTDPDLWFSNDPMDQAEAAELCRTCPVKTQCLAYALDHPKDTEFGTWAATTPEQRRSLRRKFARKDTTS
ncbi:WhiB family transcriptional regulator [Streptomyces sp. CA-111067]|uniref:WhiB family transcriptional regulator n=1 Tax=Streptomyces sp. CA-111067 TaxID=3240046 RepID=UPI003D98BC5C